MKEIYKDIIGYEGLYKVSNLGNVKSLDRHYVNSLGVVRFLKGRVLIPGFNGNGYLKVTIYRESKVKTRNIHQLVAEHFLDHTPCGHKLVVNHIDFNKANNLVTNLEVVTSRVNANQKHLKSSSAYTGVHYCNTSGKWVSQIGFNGKSFNLGYFDVEYDAHLAYEYKLKSIESYETV
jgi:hypothetical protein